MPNLISPAKENTFDAWISTESSVVQVGDTDPFGGTEAWRLAGTVANDIHSINLNDVYDGLGLYSNAALYVKEGTARYLCFARRPYATSVTYCHVFDTRDGSVTEAASGYTTITAEDAGNGWFRIGAGHNKLGVSNDNLYFGLSTDGTKAGCVGVGTTDYVHIYLAYAWQTAEPATEFPVDRSDFYIAITRRTAKQMNVKQRTAQAKPNLRDL